MKSIHFHVASISLIGLFLLLAFIILPTGTPEDLFTTAILIEHLGLPGYIVLSIGLILVMVGLGIFGSYVIIIRKTGDRFIKLTNKLR